MSFSPRFYVCVCVCVLQAIILPNQFHCRSIEKVQCFMKSAVNGEFLRICEWRDGSAWWQQFILKPSERVYSVERDYNRPDSEAEVEVWLKPRSNEPPETFSGTNKLCVKKSVSSSTCASSSFPLDHLGQELLLKPARCSLCRHHSADNTGSDPTGQ